MEQKVLNVTQLNAMTRDLLESAFALLWVEGELSNVATPASGHWYFTLKDKNAQVRCAMFRNRNIAARIRPEAGKKVLVRAKVSLYEGRGDYQLIVEHMEAAGSGDLQRQFEALKAKLAEEGLFNSDFKKPIPRWPRRVGVITSASGAALHDICHVLKRRFPALAVCVLPVAVQGEGAAAQIAQAIEQANRLNAADVLIAGRGGGSLEDLWAFNEELVARAIFASDIPVVSAVGHEVDFTIADFVADARAPTPSAAAEMVSPNQEEVLAQLHQIHNRLQHCMRGTLQQAQRSLTMLCARVQHPRHKLQAHAQRLDHLEQQLRSCIQARLERARQRLNSQNQYLIQYSPTAIIDQRKQTLRYLSDRLDRATLAGQAEQRERLQRGIQLLNSFSPLNTLQRGYAIVRDSRGEVVRDAAQVTVGERVTALLGKGRVECTVEDRSDPSREP